MKSKCGGWLMWSDILWIVIPIVFSVAVMFFVFRKAKGGKRKNFTEHTIGILRGVLHGRAFKIAHRSSRFDAVESFHMFSPCPFL